MPFIEIESVSYSYPESSRPALGGVSVTIGEGEYVAVVGANGSGKSSLLRLLNGLRVPSSGEVRVDGHATSGDEGRKAARAAVGLVFQSPADQIVSSSVQEDVAFGPENLGLPRTEIAARVGRALDAVGLGAERDRASHFLSAGQQQRLAVAGVLAMDVRCVAFDEATAMLDPEARLKVLALMDDLAASGKTVVHVTHDMSEASRAGRVLVLERGALVFDGSPDGLFAAARDSASAPAIHALGLPDCIALAVALGLEPRRGEPAAAIAARIAADSGQGGRTAGRAAGRAARTAVGGGAAPASGTTPGVSPEDPVFELRAAGHSYLRGTVNETESLRSVDLRVGRAEVVAFVGRTGSGKSTALQLMDGLVAPSSGTVRAFGSDLGGKGADLRAVRTRAPLAVQRPESALFERYSGDDVAFGPRNIGLSGKVLVERVRSSMEETGLGYGEFRDRRTRSLSGGEKRRLALAGVLAMGGDALLLDEPTSSLDPATKRSVLDIITGQSLRGSTVVMATHSMEEAAQADHVAVFAGGGIVAFGDPVTVFYDLYDPSWGLGRPFACEVAIELEARGLDLGLRPLALDSLVAALAATS